MFLPASFLIIRELCGLAPKGRRQRSDGDSGLVCWMLPHKSCLNVASTGAGRPQLSFSPDEGNKSYEIHLCQFSELFQRQLANDCSSNRTLPATLG